MSMTPKRIQRKRTKGWRMPENTVYVGRPTLWGNIYPVDNDNSYEDVVKKYRILLKGIEVSRNQADIDYYMWVYGNIHELRGKDLACWCSLDHPCHADVLLELANRNEN